jgi:uncharacterized protein YhbP (UPF0306 family)
MARTPAVEVPDNVLAYLDAQPTLTLATVGAGGVPRATTLTYVNDGLSVFVWMRPETTTARQMQENPIVSLAIDRYAADWRETQGIQAAAEAQVVLNPSELSRVVELFERKYPSLAGSLGSGVSIFRLTPTELQFIDNSNASAGSHGGGVSYARDTVFSVFRDLPEEAIENVAGELKTVQVGEGDVVVRQGAPADKFFIITSRTARRAGSRPWAAASSSARWRSCETRREWRRCAQPSRRRSLRWTVTRSVGSSRSRWEPLATSTR